MDKKVLIGLIILGIIFVGSTAYALFNENLLLNDVTSDIQTNDTSLSNNQSNIQNNPVNVQNNQSGNIISGENSNLVSNNMANTILNDISEINDNGGQKVVKERFRVTVNNETQIFYDDGSFIVLRDNHTYSGRDMLTRIYDTNDMDGGYIQCAECMKFLPVGNVSGLVPEDYLCNCTNTVSVKSVKDVLFLYSEEDVLEHIKLGFNNAFDDSSNTDMNVDVDDVNQNSANNIDKQEFKIPDDFKLPNTNPWEVDVENYHGMDMNNYRNIFVLNQNMDDTIPSLSPEEIQKLMYEHNKLVEQLNQQIEQTNKEISGHKFMDVPIGYKSVPITECFSNDISDENSVYSSMSLENSAEPQLDSDLKVC